jgi:hypothetical protein
MNCLWMIWSLLSIPFSHRNSVKNEVDVQREQAWYSNEFKPRTDVDYGIALKYAEDRYQELRDVFASLDRKAEWLYGLTVAAIAAVYLMCPDKRLLSLISWGLPSLLFSGLAFLSIVRTKIPGERPAGMSIRGAIQCVESTENPSAIISANLHCAAKELVKVNAWKANQVANASHALMVAFFLAPLVLFASPPEEAISSRAADSLPATSPSGAEPMAPLLRGWSAASLEGRLLLKFEKNL